MCWPEWLLQEWFFCTAPVATYVMACDELICMQCMQLAHATPHPVKQLKPHLLMP